MLVPVLVATILLGMQDVLASVEAKPCTAVVTAQPGDTCASIASAAGITVTQFLNGNPNVTICSGLVVGRQYCVDPTLSGTPATMSGRGIAATTTTSSSSPTDSGALQVSKDGRCGGGLTCLGSTFGQCCSEHGWCGKTSDHCGAGCQAGFGLCGSAGIVPSSGPLDSSPTTSATGTVGTTVVGVSETVYVTVTQTVRTTVAVRTTSTVFTSPVRETQTVQVTNTRTILTTIPVSVPVATSLVIQTSTTVAVVPQTSTILATATITMTTGQTQTRTVLATVTTILTRTNLIQVTSLAVVTQNSIIFTSSTITTIKTITITDALKCASYNARPTPRAEVHDPTLAFPPPIQQGRAPNSAKALLTNKPQQNTLNIQQLQPWNAQIADDCQNLSQGYWVCVGV
ncbi:hypothetical protein QBC46DRAFT_431049 [Diplogelasinospora grovesii]|uniref:Carbohydrate-binding module family 18 protein n=1 Tax=Diplogelasinospora grovesii TaxID=303347 RepID=A0AAN6MX18_9PEZI|nr:hypothetical protein QBC46DRAFT_431049 [Diplogelasinospora grovesii]